MGESVDDATILICFSLIYTKEVKKLLLCYLLLCKVRAKSVFQPFYAVNRGKQCEIFSQWEIFSCIKNGTL